jgi:hypothetical protein
MKWFQFSPHVLLTACAVLLPQSALRAQVEESTAQAQTMKLEVRFADQNAVSTKAGYRVHVRPINIGNVNRFSPVGGAPSSASQSQVHLSAESTASAALVPAPATITAVPSPGFYPADLTNPFGGPVVSSAENHPVFVDCPESCWGAPINFLNHLVKSQFMHIVDQYTGSTTNNRYAVGKTAAISYPIVTTLSDNDLLQIAHSAASSLGSGYDHIYHIFLPKGVDLCFVGTTECYSPDNLSTFAFCAFHASVDFPDIGHVLFTAEPYQNVPGCAIQQPSPNGALIDSTSSALSHETFETITDPDPPTGFIAVKSGGVFGEEIGDLCVPLANPTTTPIEANPPTSLFGKNYAIQPEYSNRYHACSFVP